MTVAEAIAQAQELTGNALSNETLVRWLSELDGRLAFEFYGADAWIPYDPGDPTAVPPDPGDLGTELLVPFPWDRAYVPYLEAMTYYSNGEYDRYANAQAVVESSLSEFRKFVRRIIPAVCSNTCYYFAFKDWRDRQNVSDN